MEPVLHAVLEQPHLVDHGNHAAVIMAFSITFTLVFTLCICFGFGHVGIVNGLFAAAFQSFMYGAFTPVGSIFANLTCMAMTRVLIFPVFIIALIIATRGSGGSRGLRGGKVNSKLNLNLQTGIMTMKLL
ncbi:predicted protein [Coccidioides posadasii str. Silveira]|uniref:Predicted protein n=1 Tax=Coccidioides posadasii (strain RMSCC 757 / Silveira) TaxID=443226 RepID=E9DEI3_COCPS|nr:predicted protein [Coccidioides posadasii str. Silveira]